MKKKLLPFFFFYILYAVPVIYAQSINNHLITPSLRNYGLITRSWNLEDGLPGDRVYDFVKDKDGFMWLATNQGLARFDGSGFKIYSDQNEKILHDSFYSSLVRDSLGNLYFLNDNRIIKRQGNSFEVLLSDLPGSELISDIALDSYGALWVGTNTKGLFKLKNKKLIPVDSSLGLIADRVSALTADPNYFLLIGTGNNGIYELRDGRFINIIEGQKLPSRHIRKIFVDYFHNLWIATNKGLVVFKRTKKSSWENYSLVTPRIVNTIAEDNNHNIWIGTVKNGILIYSKATLLNFSTDNGLSDNTVTKLAIYDDDIWVGTNKGGINLIKKARIFSVGKKEGLNQDYVNSVFEDNDGSILIGTASGLYKLNRPFSQTPCRKTEILKNDHIFAISRDLRGNLLIGTRYHGLFIYKGRGVKNYNMSTGLNVNFIRCLFTDEDGSIWVGTNGGGIAIIKDGIIKTITRKDGLSNDLISFIHKSADGKLWVGTSGGGVNIIDNKGKINLLDRNIGLSGDIISSIYEEADGDIWLTINGGGVALIRRGKIAAFTTKDGLFSNIILNLVFDDDNTFWFSTPKGIFSVKKNSFLDYMSGKIKQIKYRYFDKSDGMIASRCVGTSPQTAAITKNNIALFSTTKGLVEIKPSMIKQPGKNIRLYLNQVLINNKPVEPGEMKDIPPHPERIEFSFGAINFQNPGKLNFKCRLAGVDKGWIELGKNKSIGYSHLPYGRYKFKLIGYDPGNNVDMGEADIAFFIEPYFWETLYFRIIFSVFVIILLVLITRYINKRKYEQQINSLEAEKALEKERMRISTDMHDEFGASLSKISLLSEIAKNNISDKPKIEKLVNEISDSGRTLAASMDEIVWAVNPRNDRLDKMLYYISNYFENHLSLTNISFRVQIPDEVPDSFISAEVRHNIFSVIKEGINNTLKHSGASAIELVFHYSNNRLAILLKDNGSGIDFGKITEFSNGIVNMKKRIHSIGGTIEIKNGAEKGAEIGIELLI